MRKRPALLWPCGHAGAGPLYHTREAAPTDAGTCTAVATAVETAIHTEITTRGKTGTILWRHSGSQVVNCLMDVSPSYLRDLLRRNGPLAVSARIINGNQSDHARPAERRHQSAGCGDAGEVHALQ